MNELKAAEAQLNSLKKGAQQIQEGALLMGIEVECSVNHYTHQFRVKHGKTMSFHNSVEDALREVIALARVYVKGK